MQGGVEKLSLTVIDYGGIADVVHCRVRGNFIVCGVLKVGRRGFRAAS